MDSIDGRPTSSFYTTDELLLGFSARDGILAFAVLIAVGVIVFSVFMRSKHRWSNTRAALVAVLGVALPVALTVLMLGAYCTAAGCFGSANVIVSLKDVPTYPINLRICVDKTELLCVNDTLEARPTLATQEGHDGPVPGAFCAAGICVTPLADSYTVDFTRLTGEDHKVRVQLDEVRSADEMNRPGWFVQQGQELALTKFAPNGEQCGPVCWGGTVTFNP